jgi:hypothetical protein
MLFLEYSYSLVKCHVSSTQSGSVIQTIEKKLFKGYFNEPLLPQSALRALTIKDLLQLKF